MTQRPDETAAHDPRANSFPWPPVLLVLAVVMAWGLGRTVPLAWPGIDDWPARAVGLGIGVLGLMLIASGARSLMQHETTVRPDKAAATLVTDGPYRYLRNPIYLGDALALLGLAELTKNVWFAVMALLFAVLVTRLQILPEERHLEERFGEAYRDYKARTRRWI